MGFLVEVADPPEAAEFGYTVNGLLLSDFFTPQFYDPVAADGVRYSFGGHIPGPRQILRGGYISWHEPVSDHWWQQIWFGTPEPRFRDLGKLTARNGSYGRLSTPAPGPRRVSRRVVPSRSDLLTCGPSCPELPKRPRRGPTAGGRRSMRSRRANIARARGRTARRPTKPSSATAVAGDVRPSWRPKMESDELDSGEEEARSARAARLREQIDRLKRDRNAETPEEPSDAESPRAFIERRMREIEAEEGED